MLSVKSNVVVIGPSPMRECSPVKEIVDQGTWASGNDLAFGGNGSLDGRVPPNAVMVYRLELLTLEP